MSRLRIALGIRAQLLLVLSVFLAIPWLGYEYVRELERFLRDAQEKTLAGTAQAVATALHDRPRLFDAAAAPRESLAVERSQDGASSDTSMTTSVPRGDAPGSGGGGSAEIAQIVQGLSRTTARIFVIDRELNVLARAGSLKRPPLPEEQPADFGIARVGQWLERETLHPLYALVLRQPSEDFGEEQAGRVALPAREVDGAMSGILTVDRRPTSDGKAVVVSAAHPIWVGDQVKGAVVVEETTNAVLAERNRAFERLFSIVLAALLIGSLALTLFASRLSARIRRLRDEAEAAIDAQGRVRGSLAGSDAGDEIGDLSRSFSSVLSRLAQYASYRENMASRLSHELRTPIAVVRSSLDNLKLSSLPDDARVYMDRAHQGLNRLTHILTRMTEATRLEQSVGEDERVRFDLAKVVAGCVDGYRAAYPRHALRLELPPVEVMFNGAPELIAQMLDKLVANAVEFSADGMPIVVRLERGDTDITLSVENEGPLLPEAMQGRLFDSMVSVRGDQSSDAPHLGLGLYIVRLIAEAHRGHAEAQNRGDGRGVVVSVTMPYAVLD
jgi:two-component system, OmpR family, sensor histidine kinase ChvG